MQFIDLQRQYRAYQADIDARMRNVLEHGQYILGPEVAELEGLLAQRIGVKHAITCANGTASLEIALRAIGIGPGDEVITTPFTWISTAEVVKLVGATPRFVDIDAESFNLDPDQLPDAVTDRTRAVIAVDLFGQMADYERIRAVADVHGLTVIEDGAQSLGATRNGTASCGAAPIGSTSFFPTKTLGCYGDGGALFTSDDTVAERITAIRVHGDRRHEHRYLGTNGRFDTLQAAVVLAKLPNFDRELSARRRIADRYTARLRDVCRVPVVCSGNTHVYSCYTIRVRHRDRVAEALRDDGVPTRIYYPRCLHEQPVLSDLGYGPGDFPVAERAALEVISLPMHPFLTDAEQDRVVDAVRRAVERVEPAVTDGH